MTTVIVVTQNRLTYQVINDFITLGNIY